MKKLIIAEKPSYAKTCGKAIEKVEAIHIKDGYYESEHYLVSYAFGHLFRLLTIDEYLQRDKTPWRLEELPFVPEKFRFCLQDDPGIKKQFRILKQLMNRSDVDGIINCGDADREGEIIVRLIVEHGLKSAKPIYRIWSGSQTEEEILENLQNLKKDSDYDLLADEGFSRVYLDWMLGINITRFLSIRSGRVMNAGRVLVPIVKAVYDRDMEIKNFTPQKYYVVQGKDQNGIELTVNEGPNCTKEKARDISEKLNQGMTVVSNVEKKQVKSNAPKLFSLSKLQSYIGNQYKYSPDETLEVVQSLYEKGYVSYPRTNTEFLGEDEKEKVQKIIKALSEYPLVLKDKKSIFDDSKIEGHSALVPLYKLPDHEKLSRKEKIIYDTIRNRFIAVFCKEECILNKTLIKIQNGDITFSLQGKSVQQAGWMKYEKTAAKDKLLPDLQKGDVLSIRFKEEAKKTTPPKHYTIATLMTYLEKPFRQEKKDMDEAYRMMLSGVTIGTPATRAGIIKNAIDRGYLLLSEKGSYTITELGENFIHLLDQLHINLYRDTTVEINQWLIKVREKEMSIEECIEKCKKRLIKIITEGKEITVEGLTNGQTIGPCPLCGKPVRETKTSYVCEDRHIRKDDQGKFHATGCPFFLYKTTKFCDMKISSETARDFLTKGWSKVSGLKKKEGGTFTAKVIADFSEFTFETPFPKYKLEFLKRKKHSGKK